jgi:aminoglycoside phosphotransferase family enzyme
MNINTFIDHNGNNYTMNDEKYTDALKNVANFHRKNAKSIYINNKYASHVTNEKKKENLNNSLKYADDIENGIAKYSFTLWQQINTELTGECIALFNK